MCDVVSLIRNGVIRHGFVEVSAWEEDIAKAASSPNVKVNVTGNGRYRGI